MKITIDINDQKAGAFLNFIKSLDFIKIEHSELTVPEWQQKIVRDRVDNTNDAEYLTWEEVERQLKMD